MIDKNDKHDAQALRNRILKLRNRVSNLEREVATAEGTIAGRLGRPGTDLVPVNSGGR